MYVLNDKNILFTEGKAAKPNGLEVQAIHITSTGATKMERRSICVQEMRCTG
jgi:hypothetical protein